MELRVLRYFLTAAREENITRAAETLHITQPSLSRQLMQLEEELGVKLFVRGRRRLALTEGGMLLRQRAEEMLSLADKTAREFYEHQELGGGTISIGSTETMAAYVLPDLLKEFIEEYPRIGYELFCGNSDDVKERLDRGLLDIGIIREPINTDEYDSIRIPLADRWGILLPVNDPLSGSEQISPAELAEKSLIIPSRIALQDEIADWFRNVGITPRILATYNTFSIAVALARKGVGTAVCPETALSLTDKSLCFRPFDPPHVTTGFFIWKKQRVFSEAAAKFLRFAKNAFQA